MSNKKSSKSKQAPAQPVQQFDPLAVLKVLDEAASAAPLTRQGHVNVQQAVKILTVILVAPAPEDKKEDKKDGD